MKLKKGNLLQKMISVLLTAVLVIGMSVGEVPAEVPAEVRAEVRAEENTEISESVSENTTEPIEEEIATESETEPEPVTESETEPEPVTEGEMELETQPEADTVDVMLMVTQADSNIASGTDWVLNGNGLLTIKSNAGMTNWISNRNTYKLQVQSVVIESGVTSIGTFAFQGCTGLTGIEIPSKVTQIGQQAFSSCTGLTSVTMLGTTPPTLGNVVFWACNAMGENSIHVPHGCSAAYKEKWSTYDSTYGTQYASYIEPNTHNLTLVPAKTATCIENGNIAYYTCSGCDKWFTDDEGTTEIADKSGVEIDPTGHTFGEWNVTKPATEQATGSKERNCEVCKYKQTEVIPKKETTESGKIETEVQTDEKTMAVQLVTDKKELEDLLLTEEEKQQVENGIDIEIILDVKDASGSVSREDKKTIEAALNGYTMGQYLDISLYKLIADKRSDITQTKEKITITIAIPDNMKDTDGNMKRTFAIMRMHDGAVELLTDLDNSADTVTIATDRFSTYAIVYKDGENENVGNDDLNSSGTDSSSSNNKNSDIGNNEKDNEPKTGETTPVEICATIAMIAGFSYLLDLFGNIKGGMTEQEKKEMVASIIAWGRKGGKLRRLAALALIFAILVYYHSIGRQVDVDWKEAYGE